jgi:hypothetical protein
MKKELKAMFLDWFFLLSINKMSVKIISVLLINSILLSYVYGQAVSQVLEQAREVTQYKQVFDNFTLPYSYGKITDANYAGSDVVIINIQDLHLHPEVQKNIGSIISSFDKSYGVKNVYLEGTCGQINTSWLTKIKNANEKMMDSIFSTGILTGAEYYSAISDRTDLIKGLERKEPYLENLKRFGDILNYQSDILNIITSIYDDIKYLKSVYYNNKQKKAEEIHSEYEFWRMNPEKYFHLMEKYANSFGIDINKYENIETYITLLKLGREINYDRSTGELKEVILKLREVLPYNVYKMLLDATSNFSQTDKLYMYLIKLARENNLDLSKDFPNLNKFLNYIELSQKINSLEMVKEEQRLKDEISVALASDDGQKDIAFLASFEKYLRDYLTSKITSEDYAYYKENIKKFKGLWVKYIDNKKIDRLEQYEKISDKFYEVNLNRNNYFIDNIDALNEEIGQIQTIMDVSLSSSEKVVRSLKEAKKVYVVVTGGFHTQGISDLLSSKGISYLVITPNVGGGIKLAQDAYYALAKEQSKILFQTLATLPLSEVTIEQRFIEVVDVLSKKGYNLDDINQILKSFESEGIKAEISGDINNLSQVRLFITKDNKTKEYIYDGQVFAENIVTRAWQINKKSLLDSIIDYFKNKLGFYTTMAVGVAIVMSIIFSPLSSFMWFLLPLVIILGSIPFISFQFYMRSFLSKESLSQTDIPDNLENVALFKKVIKALPLNLAQEFVSKALNIDESEAMEMLLDENEDVLAQKISGFSETFSRVESISMLSKDGMISINYDFFKAKFFDRSGNIVNQNLLEVFVRHELRRQVYIKSSDIVIKWIHKNSPLIENMFISIMDLFDFFCVVLRNVYLKIKSISSIFSSNNLDDFNNIFKDIKDNFLVQKIKEFHDLNPQVVITKEILMMLGNIDETLAQQLSDDINSYEDLTKKLVRTPDFTAFKNNSFDIADLYTNDYTDVIAVRDLLNYLKQENSDLDVKSFLKEIVDNIDVKSKDYEKNNSAFMWDSLKKALIVKAEENLFEKIKKGENLQNVLGKAVPIGSAIVLKRMLDLTIIDTASMRDIANSKDVSSYLDLFNEVLYQKIVLEEFSKVKPLLPENIQTLSTQEKTHAFKKISRSVGFYLLSNPLKLDALGINGSIDVEVEQEQTISLSLRSSIIYNLLQINQSTKTDWQTAVYFTLAIDNEISKNDDNVSNLQTLQNDISNTLPRQVDDLRVQINKLNTELKLPLNEIIEKQIEKEGGINFVNNEIARLNKRLKLFEERALDIEQSYEKNQLTRKRDRLEKLLQTLAVKADISQKEMEIQKLQKQIELSQLKVIDKITSMTKVLLLRQEMFAEIVGFDNAFDTMTDEKWKDLFNLFLEESNLYSLSIADFKNKFPQIGKVLDIKPGFNDKNLNLPDYMQNKDIVNIRNGSIDLVKALACYYDHICEEKEKSVTKDLKVKYQKDTLLKFNQALNSDYLKLKETELKVEVKSVQDLIDELYMDTSGSFWRGFKTAVGYLLSLVSGVGVGKLRTPKQKIKAAIIVVALVLLTVAFFLIYFLVPFASIIPTVLAIIKFISSSVLMFSGEIVMIVSFVRDSMKNGFDTKNFAKFIIKLIIFTGMHIAFLFILSMPMFAPIFMIIGVFLAYNANNKMKISYKKLLARESYGLVIEGSTVRGYFEDTLEELKKENLISDEEIRIWKKALEDPEKNDFIAFKNPEANNIVDFIFKRLSSKDTKFPIAASRMFSTDEAQYSVEWVKNGMSSVNQKKGGAIAIPGLNIVSALWFFLTFFNINAFWLLPLILVFVVLRMLIPRSLFEHIDKSKNTSTAFKEWGKEGIEKITSKFVVEKKNKSTKDLKSMGGFQSSISRIVLSRVPTNASLNIGTSFKKILNISPTLKIKGVNQKGNFFSNSLSSMFNSRFSFSKNVFNVLIPIMVIVFGLLQMSPFFIVGLVILQIFFNTPLFKKLLGESEDKEEKSLSEIMKEGIEGLVGGYDVRGVVGREFGNGIEVLKEELKRRGYDLYEGEEWGKWKKAVEVEERARVLMEEGREKLEWELVKKREELEEEEGEGRVKIEEEVKKLEEEMDKKVEGLKKAYEEAIKGVEGELRERADFLKKNPFGVIVEKLNRNDGSWEAMVGLIKEIEGSKELRGELVGIVKGYIKGNIKPKVVGKMKGKVPKIVIEMVEGLMEVDVEELRGEGLKGVVSRIAKENIGILKGKIEEELGIELPSEEEVEGWISAMKEKGKIEKEEEVEKKSVRERIGEGIEVLRKELVGKVGKAKEEIEEEIDKKVEEYEVLIKEIEGKYVGRYKELEKKLEGRVKYEEKKGEEVIGLVERIMGYDGSVEGLEGIYRYIEESKRLGKVLGIVKGYIKGEVMGRVKMEMGKVMPSWMIEEMEGMVEKVGGKGGVGLIKEESGRVIKEKVEGLIEEMNARMVEVGEKWEEIKGEVEEKLRGYEGKGEELDEMIEGMVKDEELKGKVLGIVKGYIRREVVVEVKKRMEGKVPGFVLSMIESVGSGLDGEGIGGEGIKERAAKMLGSKVGEIEGRLRAKGYRVVGMEKVRVWIEAMGKSEDMGKELEKVMGEIREEIEKQNERLKEALRDKEGEGKGGVDIEKLKEEIGRKKRELMIKMGEEEEKYRKEMEVIKGILEEREREIGGDAMMGLVEKLEKLGIERDEGAVEELFSYIEGSKELRGEIVGIVEGYYREEVLGMVSDGLRDLGELGDVLNLGIMRGIEGLSGIGSVRELREKLGEISSRVRNMSVEEVKEKGSSLVEMLSNLDEKTKEEIKEQIGKMLGEKVSGRVMGIIGMMEGEKIGIGEMSAVVEAVGKGEYYKGRRDEEIVEELGGKLKKGLGKKFMEEVKGEGGEIKGIEMLRGLFYDEEGKLKNEKYLEGYVKGEYGIEPTRRGKIKEIAISALDKVEEVLGSMGNMYTWQNFSIGLVSGNVSNGLGGAQGWVGMVFLLVSLVIFIIRKVVETIDENKEGEVGIGEIMKEGIDILLSNFDIKKVVAEELASQIVDLETELENKGYKLSKELYARLNSFDGSAKALDELFDYVDNDKDLDVDVKIEIKEYFKNKVLVKVKSNLKGKVPDTVLELLDNFVRTGEISSESVENILVDELEKKVDKFMDNVNQASTTKANVTIEQLEQKVENFMGNAETQSGQIAKELETNINNVGQMVLKEVGDAIIEVTKQQSRLYYREIEDTVIDLLYPAYVENSDMFSLSDEKYRPRLMVFNGEVESGDTSMYEGSRIMKASGYSVAMVERVGEGIEINRYRMPVNVVFEVGGEELVYDVYVREINGLHVIGLKMKENIRKELDTQENYKKAVIAFSKDINTNSVLRAEFGKLKSKAANMYGISNNLQINPQGISMIDFEVGGQNGYGDKEGEGNVNVFENMQEELKGIYIVEGLKVEQGNLLEIEQQIKSEEIYSLDDTEKYYEVNLSEGKLKEDFVKKAVKIKKEQGATAIILNVAGNGLIDNEEDMKKLLVAMTTIHSLGLKVVMKVDVNRFGEELMKDMFKKIYEMGFDGINIEASKEAEIGKLKRVLEILKDSSETYAVEPRNTINLKSEDVKDELKKMLGERGYEGHNLMIITEINIKTGRAKIDNVDSRNALNKGYKRGRKVSELKINVKIKNMSEMVKIVSTKAEELTVGQIMNMVKSAGVNIEIENHITRILKGAQDGEKGTDRALEALGFARGVIEAGLIEVYKETFDFSEETYEMNNISDREAMGVVLMKAYLANPERFESKEALKEYINEAEILIMKEAEMMTFEEERSIMVRYVNSVVKEVEETGMMENKEVDAQSLAISIAVLNDSINKISFNRIVEDAKRRARTSTNVVKNILSAA